MSTTPVFVTGATGNIGSPLVRMLQTSNVPIRALSRDRARAQKALGVGVEVVEGDLGVADGLETKLAGCERAFFLGPAGPELKDVAKAFAVAAKKAGVRHVVAVSSGTIDMKPAVALGNWHAAMEEAFASSGLATTFLRPDNFSSNSLRWARTIRAKGMVFSPNADSLSVPIDPYDIAAVAHAALTQPGHEGKVHRLSGPAPLSMREQAGIISRELGRPVNVVEVPVAQARQGMIDGGVPAWMADAILELAGHAPRPTNTVREVTGKDARPFATWVRENVAAFAPSEQPSGR